MRRASSASKITRSGISSSTGTKSSRQEGAHGAGGAEEEGLGAQLQRARFILAWQNGTVADAFSQWRSNWRDIRLERNRVKIVVVRMTKRLLFAAWGAWLGTVVDLQRQRGLSTGAGSDHGPLGRPRSTTGTIRSRPRRSTCSRRSRNGR